MSCPTRFVPRTSRDIRDLIDIMAALRSPDGGCAWDLKQTNASIAPYTIEEAYEVADAVERGDPEDLRDELGDLLLQVVFFARMAEEDGHFDFGGVVEAITAKLIRRHPHVFGDARDLDPAAVVALWDEIKRAEKRERGRLEVPGSALDGIPLALPALMRADKLARKAAAVGFTWPDAPSVLAKVDEELREVRDAVASGDEGAAAEEIGDLLFTVANLARRLEIDPEAALGAANRKFEHRFRAVEAGLAARGSSPAEATMDEMDALWTEAKAAER